MFGADAAAAAPMPRMVRKHGGAGGAGGGERSLVRSKAMRSITKKLNASRRQRQQQQAKGRTTRT